MEDSPGQSSLIMGRKEEAREKELDGKLSLRHITRTHTQPVLTLGTPKACAIALIASVTTPFYTRQSNIFNSIVRAIHTDNLSAILAISAK